MADAILTTSPAPNGSAVATVQALRQQLGEVNQLLWDAYTLVHAAAADADNLPAEDQPLDSAELSSPASRVVRLLMMVDEKIRAAMAASDRPVPVA